MTQHMKKLLTLIVWCLALLPLQAQQPHLGGTRQDFYLQGDHGRLAATLQKPALAAGQRCPLVVLMHGFSGNKENPMFWYMADSLQAHGVASLRFDFNGHGKSEGKFTDMTVPNEIQDARQVISYALSQPWVDGVMLAGHSQGGVVASMTAGLLGDDQIRRVVLLAPAAVLRDDAIRGSTMGASYDPLSPPDSVKLYGGLHLGRRYIETAFSLPIYETAARYQGPALIIHGTGDRVVPYTYGERYHSIWKNSRIEILPGYDHGLSQDLHRVTDMAVSFLLGCTPSAPQP